MLGVFQRTGRFPARELRERVARGVREADQFQLFVAPEHVHEAGAGFVGGLRDVTNERRVFECDPVRGGRAHQQALSRPQVQPDADGEFGILLEVFLEFCRHGKSLKRKYRHSSSGMENKLGSEATWSQISLMKANSYPSARNR